MSTRSRVSAGALLAVMTVVLSACGDGEDLSIVNDGPDQVVVDTGDGDPSTVDPDGGVVLLDYGCTPGDVVVTFPSGRRVTVPGPVCPGRELVIGDGTAALSDSPISST